MNVHHEWMPVLAGAAGALGGHGEDYLEGIGGGAELEDSNSDDEDGLEKRRNVSDYCVKKRKSSKLVAERKSVGGGLLPLGDYLSLKGVRGDSSVKKPKLVSSEKSGNSGKKNTCSHPRFLKGMCFICGESEEDDGSGVSFDYKHKDLRLGSSEVERLRGSDLKDLMGKKKIILILDLDYTLLNSTLLSDITPEEEYLLRQAESNKDDLNRSLFKLESMHMLTKLRPFVRNFLKEASSNFEMYVYTMAEKSYAFKMANILDPGKVYFQSKVISQADCTQPHQKGLDVVLGAESMAVILDDTEYVWQRHKESLIEMERYHFFAHSSQPFGTNRKSLSQLMKDERESDGVLATILNVLKRTHQSFFEPTVGANVPSRDVRQVLKNIKKEILQGCKIVFTGFFPLSNKVPQDEPIWRMAERLGAVCCTEVDSSVTHVVSKDVGTKKSRWALQNEKFLVNQYWIEGAHFLWRRQREEDFPVGNAKKKQ